MVIRMHQHKIICTWVHYTGLSRVQISLLHRFDGRSTRARACRTDCSGGGSIGRLFNPTGAARVRMYTNITCLSREHPPPPRVEVLSTEHHAHRLRGKYQTDCTRPPRHLYTTAGLYIFPPPDGTHPTTARRKYSYTLSVMPVISTSSHGDNSHRCTDDKRYTRGQELKCFRSRLLRAIE